ncbi:MAG: 3-oxoacyl-ACP reductase FabG [Candidatus Rokubacteria bacterium]|nr:3-oxoacyl-ACP reductase FabG [Candidatus Rokubacteria bacterium]
MVKLDGRVAVVTGGQRGLGKAIVEEFAREGAVCVVNYPGAGEAPDAEALVASLVAGGGRATAIRADIADWDAAHGMVGRIIDAYGRLDILVNNAGINTLRTWEDLDRASWDRTLAVNLTGVFNCCKAALEPMKRQHRGNIINMSSIAAFIGRGNADYIASKNALLGLTRSLARQYGRVGIRANAIAPGFHNTEMVREALRAKESADEFIKQVPLGFLPEPDSIGKAALFLASDDSYYITGHMLVVDGGLTLR